MISFKIFMGNRTVKNWMMISYGNSILDFCFAVQIPHKITESNYALKMKKTSTVKNICQGVRKGTTIRCKKYAIKGGEYCELHIPDSPFVCQGFTRTGAKCGAAKEEGSDYCCEDHNPANIRSTDPAIFRIPGLRASRMNAVLEYRNNMDLYSDEAIEIKKDGNRIHLDHHVELNLGRDVFDSLRKNDLNTEDAEKLKSDIKVTFNENFNLSFTDEKVNMKKTAAMQQFADAYKADEVKGGLEYYVLETFHMATRGKTSRIITEVTTSFDSVIDHMRNNTSTTRSNELYVEGLADMMTAMKLT